MVALSQLNKGGQTLSCPRPGQRETSRGITETAALVKSLLFKQALEKPGGEGITGTGDLRFRYYTPAAGCNGLLIFSVSKVTDSGNCSATQLQHHSRAY